MAGFNNTRRALTVPNGNPYTWHGNVDGLNGTGLLEPGEIGAVLPWQGAVLQLVKLDSGVTSATPTGIVLNGQIAFWKDRNTYVVTNDVRFADGGVADARNSVAGVFEPSALAGEYLFVTQESDSTNVLCTSTPTAGAVLVANTGSSADSASVAAGTAPTSQVIGTVLSAKVNGKVPAALRVISIQ